MVNLLRRRSAKGIVLTRGLAPALVALLLAGCGSAGDDRDDPNQGAAATESGSSARPAVAVAADLAELGGRTGAPIAAIADPESGPRTLVTLGHRLDALEAENVRISEEVERTGAPLPAQIIAAAKLQLRALEGAEKLASKLAGLEGEANEERTPSQQAQSEMTALAANVGDLRPLATRVGRLQDRQLAALRKLLHSATRVAREAEVAKPLPLDGDLRSDPGLRAELTSAVTSVSQRMSSLAGTLAAAPPATPTPTDTTEVDVVSTCGDDPGIYGLAARNLSCDEAHRLAVGAVAALAPEFTVAEYSCAILGQWTVPATGGIQDATDVRCEYGERAFSFNFSA